MSLLWLAVVKHLLEKYKLEWYGDTEPLDVTKRKAQKSKTFMTIFRAKQARRSFERKARKSKTFMTMFKANKPVEASERKAKTLMAMLRANEPAEALGPAVENPHGYIP